MDVLFVTSWFPGSHDWKDGNFIGEHALALESQGHRVKILHERFSNKYLFPRLRQYEYEGLSVFQLALPRWLIGQLWVRRILAKRGISKIIRQGFDPNIVHGHVLIPVAPTAAFIAAHLKLPLVFTEHYTGFVKDALISYDQRMLDLSQSAISRVELIMPVSNSLAQGLKKWGVDRPSKVVYNTMNADVFHYLPNPAELPFTFLHVSNFRKGMKNVDGIMRAFSVLSESYSNDALKLIVAGDGDISDVLVEREKISNACNIEIRGSLSYQEVAKLMQDSDCFVLFSSFETFSCVTAEALLCGLPVIASDVGPLRERINATNGILVPAGDEAALSKAMDKMIANRLDYDRSAIAAGSNLKYSYEAIARQFLENYEQVIQKHGSAKNS